MKLRVLAIDDDARLRGLLREYLAQNEIEVVEAEHGARGLQLLRSEPFDAVLLDIMMPGMDGLEVLRTLRKEHRVPVIMLTAKGDETDRIVGLEIGADDYLGKPFAPRELLARLRAIWRRSHPEPQDATLNLGALTVNLDTRTATDSGVLLDLTGIEFEILCVLVKRAGRVLTREALLKETGRDDAIVLERTIDVHISRLRQKLGDDPKTPQRIKTVRGVGYVMSKEG